MSNLVAACEFWVQLNFDHDKINTEENMKKSINKVFIKKKKTQIIFMTDTCIVKAIWRTCWFIFLSLLPRTPQELWSCKRDEIRTLFRFFSFCAWLYSPHSFRCKLLIIYYILYILWKWLNLHFYPSFFSSRTRFFLSF